MITRTMQLLLATDESGNVLVSAYMIADALEKAGFIVESGNDILLVRAKNAP